MNEDMQTLATEIEKFLAVEYETSSMCLQKLVTMTAISYYSKAKWAKSDMNRYPQTSMHRDQQYTKSGEFMTESNSQVKDTPVAILSLGDTRKLEFQLRYTSANGEVKPVEPEVRKTFDMTHGSLLVIDADDEKDLIRSKYMNTHLSYFMHGNVIYNKENGLSMGLVFRATNSIVQCNPVGHDNLKFCIADPTPP